ncbi:MAG: LLM class flavin-dependent oxidoreductase [Deltaproteobacteria bacterium]|nr:LLM class flavin-dependent oxidoreductase [Deltaproteobacteria bacterium]
MSEPRFGIWVPVYGPWGARHHPEEPEQASYAHAREVVVEADQLGFKVALLAQHIINPVNHSYDQLETWSAAAALAEATHHIELMGAVKPFMFPPAVLAKMALGIDAISRGRFTINLISGWYLPEMEQAGLPIRTHDERYKFSREWLQVVKALWNGEKVTHHGDYFQIKGMQLRPTPVARPRPAVYLGGESEPARALAADEADVYLINGRPVTLIREVVADLRRRPRPSGVPLRFGMAGFVIARSTDGEARQEFAHLKQLAAPDDARELRKGVDPETVMFKTFAMAPRGLGSNGGTAAGLVGDYDTVAERIVEFFDAGIETFLLQFQPFKPEMYRFAEQIAPRVGDLLSVRAATFEKTLPGAEPAA